MKKYRILKRLREPSTWISIGGLFYALGFTGVAPEQWGVIGNAIGTICLVAGALIKDPGSED